MSSGHDGPPGLNLFRAVLFVLLFLAVGMVITGWVADGMARGAIEQQVGEQRLEAACNDLAVEWEYVGIAAFDGERIAYSAGEGFRMLRYDEYPAASDNVTVVCRLNQGFLSASEERVTVNVTGGGDR